MVSLSRPLLLHCLSEGQQSRYITAQITSVKTESYTTLCTHFYPIWSSALISSALVVNKVKQSCKKIIFVCYLDFQQKSVQILYCQAHLQLQLRPQFWRWDSCIPVFSSHPSSQPPTYPNQKSRFKTQAQLQISWKLRTNRTRLLDLSASLLAGGAFGLT